VRKSITLLLRSATRSEFWVECKPITVQLEKDHLAQLYRYFRLTSARFALLTNGRTFNFYTDLDEPNKLDTIPFLIFELADLQGPLLAELKKFAKNEFDFDGIRASASRLKYISAIKRRSTIFSTIRPRTSCGF